MGFINTYSKTFFILILVNFSFAASPCFAKKKRIKIKIGNVGPDGTPWSDLANTLAKNLTKEAKKRVPKKYKVKGKAYNGGTLGGEMTMVNKLLAGKLDIFGGSMGPIAKLIPELSVLELPYLFKTAQEADYIQDKIIFNKIKALMRKKGLIFMFWVENGFRNLASKSPIKSPNDLKGKKFRSQEQDIYIDTYKAFGGTPVPIAVPEVMAALQTNVVSGFDQTLLFSFATSWYTSIKHYTMTKHIYQPAIAFCGKKKFDKYPKELQAIIEDDWSYLHSFRKKVRELNPSLEDNMKKAGVNIIQLSKAQKEEFRKKVKPVYKNFRKTASKDGKEMLKLIENYLGRKN